MPDQIDWTQVARIARQKTITELQGARRDCIETARYAQAIEDAGYKVSKSCGYYHDEASIYTTELQKRGLK